MPAPFTLPRRRALQVATVALLAAAGLAGTLLVPSKADVPTEASMLSQQCQSFSRFKTWLSFPVWPEQVYKYALHAHEDGRIGMDRVSGNLERVYWDGSTLTRATADNPTPRVLDGFDEMIADVWTECRAGFSSSAWTSVPPPQDVTTASRYWMRVDLPFSWAESFEFLVGYVPGTAELRQVIIRTPTGEVESIRFYGPNWNASFPLAALGPQVPPFFPETFPGWKQQQWVADEIEAGAKADDLLIPVGPPQ